VFQHFKLDFDTFNLGFAFFDEFTNMFDMPELNAAYRGRYSVFYSISVSREQFVGARPIQAYIGLHAI